MGFVLSIFYFVTYYLTPAAIFGQLAVFRIVLILSILVFFASLPALREAFILETTQSLALIGLAFASAMSVLVGTGWAGGAARTFLEFAPNSGLAYFLVALHCNTKKKLQILVLVLLAVCLFVIANGGADLLRGVQVSPYLFGTKNDMGEGLFRLRGLGLINDPNDFGQLIVCVIPLVFLFWRRKKMAANLVRVILPVCILIFGMYLTHSRGALLALMAITILAARRRIGVLPSLVLAGGLFAAAMAINFTGGRDISLEAGADRTSLWASGLQLLKYHPLFGVGMGNFSEYAGLTAHNSLVVCAAEVGSFGLFFWCMFLFASMRDAAVIASPKKVSEAKLIVLPEELFPKATKKIEEIDKEDVVTLGRLILLSFTGFLVAGWFLSRAFAMTLFLLGGMAEVAYEMALQRGMIAPRMRLGKVAWYSLGLSIGLVLAMYVMLRIVNLIH